MLIFKIYIFLFSLVFTQNTKFKINSVDSNFVFKELNKKLLVEERLSAVYKLEAFNHYTVESVFRVINTKKMVDSVIINSKHDIRDNIIKSIFKPYKVTPIDEKYNTISDELVSRYYFLKDNPKYQLGLLDSNTLGTLVFFKPIFENHYSGILGMSKQRNRWSLNGELNLNLENYFNNIENIELFWKKIDSTSQVIKLSTSIPHPFGWNTGVAFNHYYEIFNGLYTSIQNRYQILTFLPYFDNVGIGYMKGKDIPSNKGIVSGYNEINYIAFSVFSKKDNTNDRLLPNSGTVINLEVDRGIEDKFDFMNYSILLKQFYPLSSLFYFKLKFVGKGIKYLEGKIPKSRYFVFGGASTLRGYDEKSFISTQYQISTFEFCYKPLKEFQSKLFIDIASNQLNIIKNNWIGCGIGLTQITNNSIIKLEYGLSNSSLENGKLHVQWTSRF